MYNGIGVVTPRGTGTNGYVQRNLAHVMVKKEKVRYNTEDDIKKLENQLNKPANKVCDRVLCFSCEHFYGH